MNSTQTVRKPEVGDHFTKSIAMPYTLADGTKGLHSTTVEYVVTSVSRVGFESDAVRVVDETGRPEFAGDFSRSSCSMAWFGWDAAAARGDVALVR